MYLPSQYIEKKHYTRFGGWRPYSWGYMEAHNKRCKSQWSAKYRSRSPSQGTCGVCTLRRSTMQGLVIVGLIVEEILNVDVKCLKCTGGAQNMSKSPGQDTCRVSTSRSTMPGLVARGLTLEVIWNTDVNYVSHCSQKIGQGHQVKVSAESVHWEEARFDGHRPYSWGDIEPDTKCVKVTGAQNIGQGHRVKVPAESLDLGEALCKVW